MKNISPFLRFILINQSKNDKQTTEKLVREGAMHVLSCISTRNDTDFILSQCSNPQSRIMAPLFNSFQVEAVHAFFSLCANFDPTPIYTANVIETRVLVPKKDSFLATLLTICNKTLDCLMITPQLV